LPQILSDGEEWLVLIWNGWDLHYRHS
jgi:hypothetical protein